LEIFHVEYPFLDDIPSSTCSFIFFSTCFPGKECVWCKNVCTWGRSQDSRAKTNGKNKFHGYIWPSKIQCLYWLFGLEVSVFIVIIWTINSNYLNYWWVSFIILLGQKPQCIHIWINCYSSPLHPTPFPFML